MRIAMILAAGAAISASVSLAASADYYLKIEGVSRPTSAGPIYLKVSSTGDLDGDGLPDDAVLRLACAGGELRAAHYNVISARDAATGHASGKRTHHPMVVVKEWNPASPQLMQLKPTYDVKVAKGARMSASAQGWTPITLAGADGLCAAASSAAKAVINTSRSNIKSQ